MEKILKLRAYREHETELALGRAFGVLNEIEQRISETAANISEAWGERVKPDHGIEQFLSYDLYIQRLDRAREKLLADAAKAEQKVEEARTVYIEASRDRKVIDKIREKREAAYKKELLTDEIKALDDIANSILLQKRGQSGL
ncbi:flagellar export protein FliJ [Breznakiellaceae bacterium SP9]